MQAEIRRLFTRTALAIVLWCIVLTPSEAVVFSEIMYHPPGADEAPYEWVELYNDYVVPLDIGGWSFSSGITYQFPAGTIIPGKSYFVVCADKATMAAFYGLTEGDLFGPFTGRLDNGGERLALADHMGSVMAHVKYSDRDPWPAGADATGHSLALINPDWDNNEGENWAVSPERSGSPGQPNGFKLETAITDTALIEVGEEWRYFKGIEAPSDPPDAWIDPDFDDSAWLSGPTGIGYGDGDDATLLDDMEGSYLSVFCRKEFQIENLAAIDTAVLTVAYDDGFIAYLNGDHLDRRNMGNPDEFFSFNQGSRGSAGSLPLSTDINVPKTFLRQGRNVLAIQIHNSDIASTDLSLIPSLVSRSVITSGGVSPIPVLINEVLANSTEDTFVELVNNGREALDIGFTYLSDDPEDLLKYRIPEGTLLEGWAHRAFTGTEMGFQLPSSNGAVYLTSADGERIVDAYAYETARPEMSRGRYPDGAAAWYTMHTPTFGLRNEISVETSIVINELMYHPYENDAKSEYIELYNRGGEAVDLSGWSFSKGVTFVFPPGTTLDAGEYLVVAYSQKDLYKKYRISNVIGDYIGSLDNEGERVQLVDTLGNVVDDVRYSGGGRWPLWAAGWGSSLELIDPRQDNAAPPAWAASDETDAATWTHVQYEAELQGGESEFHFFLMHRGECLIDDISVTSEDQEYIPNGSFEDGTAGWKIEGNHVQSAIYTQDTHTGSRCLKIVATGRGDTGANRIECDTQRSLLWGRTYTVSFWVKWQRGINLIYTRTHGQGLPKASRFPMASRRGTPGKPNTVRSANLGPVISNVKQTPIGPKPSEPVKVTAQISDADGVSSVSLNYKADWDSFYNSVPMYDDGLHDDHRAGDGLYCGEIPARGSLQLMRFYIAAEDSFSASQRFPAKADTDCLYQIEDLPPTTKFPIYRILLTHEVDQALRSQIRLSNELQDCTFVLNDSEIFYNCGVRTRGSGWTRGNHPSDHYRIRFNSDQPLRGVWREINLDWRTDGTRQKDRMVQHLLRQLGGVQTSYQRYVHVRFNSSFAGFAEEPQKVDGDYVRFYWPDDDAGTLFKVDDYFEWTDYWSHSNWDAFLIWQGPDGEYDPNVEKEKYRWNWELRTNEKDDNYSDFLRLVKFMDPDQTSDRDFEYTADQTLEVDEWLKVLCVRFLVDDWDTLGYDRGKNAYIYKPYHKGDGTPADPPRYGKWVLLPWDSDLTFTNTNAPIVSAKFPSIMRMLERPQYKRRYYSYFLQLIDGPFSRAEMDPVLDRIYAQFIGETGSPSGPGSIKNFVSGRIPIIRAKIPQPEFAITTNSGEGFETEDAIVALTGTAPVSVRTLSVRMNGKPFSTFQPNWTDIVEWQVSLPLSPGENVITLTAKDSNQQDVAVAAITVTRSLSTTTDTDNDGLFDKEEYEVYNTDFLNPDTDGDGLSDGDEVHLHLTNPTDEDSDNDGMTDGDEVTAGTNPIDPSSFLSVVGVSEDSNGVSFEWSSVAGRQYAVYWSPNLVEWTLLRIVTATGSSSNITDTEAPGTGARFYRIEVLPLP